MDREWFIQRESEREHYLHLLGRAIRRSDWRLLAFAIMSNHIHLAVVAGFHKLDTWVRAVHAPFAGMMNREYDRIGGMFVRGPKSLIVEPHGVGQVIAYIHNNPVRAGVCDGALGTSWTSHRAYVGLTIRPQWLDVEEGMRRSGFSDGIDFDAWVALPQRASFDEKYTGIIDEIARDDEKESSNEGVQEVRTLAEPEPAVIVAATADALRLPVRQLCSSSRGQREVLGRAVAVRVAAGFGIPARGIASALHISQQRASVLRRMELSTDAEPVCADIISALTRK